jgi:V/A-type H+-transporting ATPase subunit I
MFSLRPLQARWFETYVPHEHTVRATEILARTGVVELEIDPRLADPLNTHKLRYFVKRGRDLIVRHLEDLPAGRDRPSALLGNPVHVANQALHRLRVWSARLDYLKEQIAERQAEREDLRLLDEALRALRRDGVDLEGLFRETRFLCKCLFACPKTCRLEESEAVAAQTTLVVRGPRHDFPFMMGMPDQRAIIRHLVVEKGCEQVGIPAWLSGTPDERIHRLHVHLTALEREIARLERPLQQLRTDPSVATARANIDTLAWYLDKAACYLGGQELCHVTGWTTAEDLDGLQEALWGAGIEVVVRFPDPPASAPPPVTTLQSWWAQPYRPLLMLWGTPDAREVDPSGLLALLVPLLFGYMFPDVGHGLLLVLFALLFSKRWPDIRFLLPCGLAAMAFGLLFGDLFGFDDLIPALWLKPLEQPIVVLAVPLAFGVVLLLLGLVLAGFEAHWNRALGPWLAVDAAVLVLYLALLVSLAYPQALWVAGLALLHFSAGSLWQCRGAGIQALAGALGRLLYSLFELLLNTLSFARVGAFALAHAALSHTIMTLAQGVEHPLGWWLVVILGNLFAIVLEGLVVFVQTTRLVLFEFFVHFLRAEGRLFRPMAGPVVPLGRRCR